MIPTRAALGTAAAVLVLSGCGVAAAVTTRTTTVSDVMPAKDAAASLPLRSLPRPAVLPLKVTPPASIPPADVVTVLTSGHTEWLEILSHTGAVVAKAAVDPTNVWMVAAGPGGAYWTQNGAEYQLSATGAVRKLGAVPGDANAVVIAPDGTTYAYATSDTAQSGDVTNRIVVVRQGAPTVTIADRIDDPNRPSADAPQSWDYYLISWTSTGIAFARVQTGGCGCGSFDMQMQSAYSASINPVTEVVTPLTADWSCPLSAVGPGMETACFASDPSDSTTTGLRVTSGGVTRYNFSMSGTNVAGDAVFSPMGTSLAYITIPAAQDSCGVTWTATLRVLDLATGHAVSRTFGELTPAVWGADGIIYGSVMNAAGDSALVTVNPATLALTQLTPSATNEQFVGIM